MTTDTVALHVERREKDGDTGGGEVDYLDFLVDELLDELARMERDPADVDGLPDLVQRLEAVIAEPLRPWCGALRVPYCRDHASGRPSGWTNSDDER